MPTIPSYPKIQNIFKRDPSDPGRVIPWEYSCPEFAALKDVSWHVTEKIDGTNIRIWHDGAEWRIGGRTDKADLPKGMMEWFEGWVGEFRSHWIMFQGEAWSMPNVAAPELPGMVLYGEGYGAGIQTGAGYSPTQGFTLFDVRIPGGHWAQRDEVEDIARQLELDTVPALAFSKRLDDIVMYVRDGFGSMLGAHPPAEGVVIRPTLELKDRWGSRIIAKVKTRDFNER